MKLARMLGVLWAVLIVLSTSPYPGADALDRINLKLFFGSQDLALWAGIHHGFFAERGLELNYTYAQTSSELRNDLVSGAVDLAYTAADNSVLAYEADEPTAILMGGDSSLNEFIVLPDVTSVEDMKNRTLIVDYPDSAYALQAYDVLQRRGGLNKGDYSVVQIGSTERRYDAMTQSPREYDASMLNPPFSIMAWKDDGLKSLGKAIDLIGTYQASALFATQRWLDAEVSHRDWVVQFIAAWVKGLRWSMDPTNKDAVLRILEKELGISEMTAGRTYTALMEPGYGLERDAEFLWEGFRNVLRIRQEFVGGGPYEMEKFVNLSYYERALSDLNSAERSAAPSIGPSFHSTSGNGRSHSSAPRLRGTSGRGT